MGLGVLFSLNDKNSNSKYKYRIPINVMRTYGNTVTEPQNHRTTEPPVTTVTSTSTKKNKCRIYIYIYIERERERERKQPHQPYPSSPVTDPFPPLSVEGEPPTGKLIQIVVDRDGRSHVDHRAAVVEGCALGPY